MLQCYAQVEKKERTEEEYKVSEEDHAKESEAVYSVINKPNPQKYHQTHLEELDQCIELLPSMYHFDKKISLHCCVFYPLSNGQHIMFF